MLKKSIANNKSSLFLDYFTIIPKNWKGIKKRVLGLKVLIARDKTENT
jgi:hypothetical protein